MTGSQASSRLGSPQRANQLGQLARAARGFEADRTPSAEHDLRARCAGPNRATHLDQIVDVFYVTNRSGEKIIDRTRLDQIREALIETIEAV